MYRRIIYLKDVDGWDSLTHMSNYSSNREIISEYRFNFREVIKFKNVGDLCSALLTKME